MDIPGTTTPSADKIAGIRSQADSLVELNAVEDFDKFLTLMTEQLRHQDPLNPADPTEFVAQLATFSSVEQAIKSNQKLDSLIAATTGLAGHSAVNLIGTEVQSQTSRVNLAGAPLSFEYVVGSDVSRSVAQVRDTADRLIREVPLSSLTGQHAGEWDGNDSAGNPAPAGAYTIEILQYKGDELVGQAPAVTRSIVEEILLDPGGPLLRLANGSVIAASEVQSVGSSPSGES